jgi:hypothetical protein
VQEFRRGTSRLVFECRWFRLGAVDLVQFSLAAGGFVGAVCLAELVIPADEAVELWSEGFGVEGGG